jgi:pimeloyl-ACP methyl ester carboxylesterase
VSTPRHLELPDQVRPVTVASRRGGFAALDALPASGACERRPALLLPGFTGSKEDFIPVLGPLASAGRRVVAIDMRGQYQSTSAPAPGGYEPGELADDIVVIADAIAPDGQGVHLLGHSFGGLIAREAALARKTPILSLTLLSSGPGSLCGPRAELLRRVLAALDATGAARSADRLRAAIGRLWDEHLEPQARADGVPEHIIDFLHERMLGNSPAGLVAMGRYLLACRDRTAELAGLGRPLLVLYGEKDDAWAPAIQERMARRLGAQRVCIPEAGHSPAVEAPETTAATLTGFWRAAEDCERRATRPASGSHHAGQPASDGRSGGQPASDGRSGGQPASDGRPGGQPASDGRPGGQPASDGRPARSSAARGEG